MVKLIALDLDGTLLDPEGRIASESIQAIAAARQAGVRVVLATGRSAQEAADFAKRAGCDHLAVCLGGAGVVDTATGVFLRRWDLPEETGRRALELCLHKEIELMIFAGEEIVLDPFSRQSLEGGYPYPAFHRAAAAADDPLAYLKERGLPLTKIHGDLNPGRYPLRELAALPGTSLTSSNDHDFELVAAGVDKGRALALLALMYGVPLENCAAVGDSQNDLAMLRAVGLPIAMGNAVQAVKDAARHTAPDNAHQGAARAIAWCLAQNGG